MTVFIGGDMYVESIPRRPISCASFRLVQRIEVVFVWPRRDCKVTPT